MSSQARRHPLQSLLRAMGVRREVGRAVGPPAFLAGLGAWLPLPGIAIVEWAAGLAREPVLAQPAVHVRLLVAVPLAIIADAVLDRLCATVLSRLADHGLVADTRPLEDLASRREALARSAGIDLLLACAAVLLGQATFWGVISFGGLSGENVVQSGRLGPAVAWYGWIAFPLFLFVVSRLLVHWLSWTRVAWRVAHLPLRTESTHPDRSGGLAFVSLPTMALAIFVFALSAVNSASWSTRVLRGAARVSEFQDELLLWAGLSFALALSPVVPFIGRLIRTRRQGELDYGRLGVIYTRRFRERWLDPAEPGRDLVGTGDIQSLADLASSFDVIRRMRVLPFGLREALLLVAAIVIPMVPLVATEVPLSKLAGTLLRSFLGR